jgi:NOL1/NOP2/fmu family ribosome biogenesis protein
MSRLLSQDDVGRIQEVVRKQFGVDFEVGCVFYSKSEKDCEKVFLYSGDFLPKVDFEWIGLHLGDLTSEGFCPTIEGAQLLGGKGGKNTLSVSKEDARTLMMGLEVDAPSGVEGCVLLEFSGVFFGAGFVEGGRIKPRIPPSRRLKRV